jgi:DNA-binding SARP family transcriptional activator
LAELERLGALSADDRGQAHRCHEVLRRHLESALREHHGTDRANREYGRAAEILEAEKATGEAVRACLRGGHWQRATQLLQRVGLRAIDAGPGQLWDDLLAPELVDEDPWLSVAVARRLAGDGRLTAAAERYRHAEELFPDPGDRERAARERRLVELWTSGRPQPHLHWLDRVRAAVARHPAAYLEPAGAGPGDRLAAALAALLSGDVPAAGAPLQAVLSQAGIGPEDAETASLVLVTRLVHALVALLSGASIDVEADRIAADADRLGATWLVRQARVLRALQVGDDAELARIGHECRTMSDAWGALLADGAARVAELHTGAPSGAVFVDLAERCAELGAGTLRAWALAAAALASAIRAEPTDAAVRAADAAGRTSAVWGVGALTALAAIPASRDPTDAESRARAHARDTGLPWPEPLAHRVVHGDRGTVGKPDPRAPSVQDPLPGPVRLRCLGSFELTVAGRTLDWSPVRPRAATAFRLLALYTPRPAHRDTLLQLWPDRPDEQARHSLQVAVSSLRNLLVPDAARGSSRMIERRGESYVLVLPPGSTADVVSLSEDLDAAERARRSGCVADEIEALARAVATYRGELLPEDGPAEWVVRERDRVRLRTAAACARLAELHLLGGDLEACADAARRGVEIDPCADASWRLLIRSCDRLGDSAAAARARRGYVDMLRDLGVPLPRAGRPPMG